MKTTYQNDSTVLHFTRGEIRALAKIAELMGFERLDKETMQILHNQGWVEYIEETKPKQVINGQKRLSN